MKKLGVLLLGLATGCAGRGQAELEAYLRQASDLRMKPLASCAEIPEESARQEAVRTRVHEALYARSGKAEADNAVSRESAMSSGTGTNVQVAGVDEADRAKIATHHVLKAGQNQIEVYDRTTGSRLGTLPHGSAQMLVTGDELYVFSVLSSGEARTRVDSYRLTAGQMPVSVSVRTVAGSFTEARLAGDRVLFLANDYGSSVGEGSDCRGAYALSFLPQSSGTLWLHRLQAGGLASEPIESMAFLGATGQDAFVTEDSVYLTWRPNTDPFVWAESEDFDGWSRAKSSELLYRSVVTRVDWARPESLVVTNTATITGSIANRWSLSEAKSGDARVLHALVAVPTDEDTCESPPLGDIAGRCGWEQEYRILALEESWEIFRPAGASESFGRGESLFGVRFTGDRAYAVTFEIVDPLFAFDLSKPLEPRLTGELKVPGFSNYLHPIDGSRLLGFGLASWGKPKFSLFGIAGESPTELSTHVPNFGSCSVDSEAQYESRAFQWDDEQSLAIVPYAHHYCNGPAAGAGFLIVSVSGDKLSQRVGVAGWTPDEILYARVLKVDGRHWFLGEGKLEIRDLRVSDAQVSVPMK